MKKYPKLQLYSLPTPEYFNSPEEYQHQLKYIQTQNEINQWHNERYEREGIPPYAIKLEVGKNYDGRADGAWEILTINGELWFCSDWCCVDFGEITY